MNIFKDIKNDPLFGGLAVMVTLLMVGTVGLLVNSYLQGWMFP